MKIKIYVQPNARKSEIVGLYGDAVKIKIKAPPVDGEANAEVIRILATLLQISRNEIQIVHGETSRHKLIEVFVSAETETEIRHKLGI